MIINNIQEVWVTKYYNPHRYEITIDDGICTTTFNAAHCVGWRRIGRSIKNYKQYFAVQKVDKTGDKLTMEILLDNEERFNLVFTDVT